ncbi:hypothetical protein E4U42_001588 [Claviceps africana]|uniref:Major facilitator superfamily (MFS) profile domain-containing protein n=1 Tax=Claviceps africana TaxID=83212 RepID=A0A8K0NF40_9HYPO|nr:hypothetical protein E4U42_001588 [Claviceps africana]
MRNHMAAGWFYSPKQIASYFGTRITSLKPPKIRPENPVRVLRQLNRYQWSMFLLGFTAWMWDAVDFYTVSICLTEIAQDFGLENSQVSWALTVSLMLRAVGALLFGAFADRYGCKWPMMVALSLFVVLELATGFCRNLPQLLAVRSLYGIAMGGMYGPAASTALSDVPYDARGVLSGLYQIGFAVGSLLASVLYRALVPTTSHGWRSLFWFSAAPPLFIMVFRWYMPETSHFQALRAKRAEQKRAAGEEADTAKRAASAGWGAGLAAFGRESGRAIRENWVLFVYMVVLMAAFNSCSHGSQDLYPTFLKSQVGLDATHVVIVTVAGQLGSIVGSSVMGYLSTFSGRRLIMLVSCVVGGALVPAFVIPRRMGILVATSLLEQAFVSGVWGPVPIHLMELSPPALRTTVVGLTYQLGNLASSASATIQAVLGERFPLPAAPAGDDKAGGGARHDYGKVMVVFMACVWALLFVLLLAGPEMSQDERDEEAETARKLEEDRGGRLCRRRGCLSPEDAGVSEK